MNARDFAILAHGEQRWAGLPYVAHLDRVHALVAEMAPADTHLRTAAYLHDVVEDTPVTTAELEAQFGVVVASIVSAVTNEPGRNRRERNAATYPKIRAFGPRAILLKLADRVVNVEAGGLTGMYGREYPDFRAALFRTDNGEAVAALWRRLDAVFAPLGVAP